MKPSSTEKPVASTPKTPAARSPSSKKLPSGARRRTSSMTATATAVTTRVIPMARKRFIARPKPPRAPRSRLERLPRLLGGRTVALEQAPPAGEQAVHRCRADDRLGRHRQAHGVEHERPRLRPAHAPVERDQLLERAALVQLGVVEAADPEVGDVREAVGAKQVPRGVGREVLQRVAALDAALGE